MHVYRYASVVYCNTWRCMNRLECNDHDRARLSWQLTSHSTCTEMKAMDSTLHCHIWLHKTQLHTWTDISIYIQAIVSMNEVADAHYMQSMTVHCTVTENWRMAWMKLSEFDSLHGRQMSVQIPTSFSSSKLPSSVRKEWILTCNNENKVYECICTHVSMCTKNTLCDFRRALLWSRARMHLLSLTREMENFPAKFSATFLVEKTPQTTRKLTKP